MLKIAQAIRRTPAWRKGFAARERGEPIEANSYNAASGSRGVHLVAIWQAGWQAAQRGQGWPLMSKRGRFRQLFDARLACKPLTPTDHISSGL